MADNGDRLTVRGFSAGKYIFEDGNGDFVSYTPEEVGRPAPPQPFMDQRLTAMLRDGGSQDDNESTFGSSLQKGIYDTADMTGAGLRFLGAKETGAALSDWAQEKSRALPEPEGAVQEAGRMLPSSMVIPMALQAASYPAAFIPGPIGPAVSLALKGMAWAYPAAMGVVQYQQTKEAAQEKGIDPGAAPYITGGLETAGEIIPMAIFNRILPMGNVISSIVKQSGKDILTMPIGKFAKMAGTGMAADVGGEMVTAYGQGATEQSYGIRPDADPIGEMLGVAAPSALLSAATAGVLGGGKYISTNVYDHVLANKAIEDDNLDKRKDVRRIAAATLTDSLLSGGTQEHIQLASKWKAYSDRQINANLPIDMASPLVDVLNHVSAPIDLTKARTPSPMNAMFPATTGDVIPRRISASTINMPMEGPMQGPTPYNPAMENAGPIGPEVASDFNMPYNAAAGTGVIPSVFAARSAITIPDNNLNRPVVGQGMGPINEPVAVASPMERKVAPVTPVPFTSGVHPTLERPVGDQRTWFGPYIDVSGRAQYSGTEQTPQVQPEPVQMQPVTQPVQQPVQTATPTVTLKPEPAPKVKVPPKKMGKEPMIKTVEAGSIVKKFEETPEAPVTPAPIKSGGPKRVLTSAERDQLGLPTIKEWIQLEDGDWNEFTKLPEKNRNKVIARYNTEMADEAERMGFFSSTATQPSVSTEKPVPVKVSTKPVPVVPKKAPITKQETKEVTTKTKAKEKPVVAEEQKKSESEEKVTTLVTQPVRDFAKKMHEDVGNKVEAMLEKIGTYDKWEWAVNDRVKSKHTGKAWKVVARSWDTKNDKPLYHMKTVSGEESGSFSAEKAHEGFIKLTGKAPEVVTKQKEEKKAPEKKPVIKAETKPVEKKSVEAKQKKIEAMKKAEPVKKKDETEPTTAELTRASNQLEENIKAVEDPKKDIDAVKIEAERERQMIKDEAAKQRALFEITGDDKTGYHVTYKGKSFIDHVFKTRESAEISVKSYATMKASEVLLKKLGSKASFMRSTRERAVHGMSAGAARDIVDRFVSRLNNFPKVNVFYSYSELPQAIKDVIAEESPEIDTDSIGGFILENEGKHEIFILSDTIETEHELEKVMAHEIFGHYGIEKILGKEFKPVMLGIYESYKNDPRMKKTLKLAKISDEALKTDEGKVLAAKELMAELSTNHRVGDASFLKKFMDLVRSFLRKFNLKTEWTDNDLLRIVSASKNFVTNGPRLYTVNDSIVDSVVTKDKDGNSQYHDIGSDKQVSFMQVVDTMPDVDKISLSHPMFEWAKAGKDTLTMLRPKNLKQMSTAEEWLASPEYWQHPVLKKLFEIAMKRSDLFHQNFARFIAIRKARKDANGNVMKDENGNPIMYDTGDNVLDLCKKHMKVDWMNRTVTRLKYGKEAIERADKYRKQVNEIIDEMSTSNGMLQWRDWMDGAGHYHTGYRAEILKKCEYPVVEMVDALRDSYDRVIDERIASLEAIKAEIEADARERNIPTNEIKYPNFPTYDENGDRIYMTLKEAILEMGKWKNSYAPRTRDGKYTFKAVKTGKDGKKDLWRIQHDSRLVLNKERNEMKAKGYDVTEIEEVERLPEVIDANLRYSDIQQVMDKAFERLSKDYKDEPTKMEKLYIHHGDMIMAIRNELMSRGFRTYQMKRREDVVIKGYEMDALKQAVVYHANFASGLAKIETAKKMTEAITPKWENVQIVDEDGTVRTERRMVEGSGIDSSKERKIYATAHKYTQHQLRNADDLDKKIAKIKQVISLKYLGLSLRAPIVNATSLIITAPAAISSVVEGSTFAKIMPAMKNSMKDYTRFMIMADNGKDMTGKFDDGELEFLLEMKKSGVDNPQFTSAAMGGITSTTIGSTWDNIVTSGMSLFRVSEQLIRGTTMLAAYRVAKQQGRTEEDARQLAEEATMRANAVYNRPSDPLWAMGDGYGAKVGQLYYMYMKFPHNYLQLLYHTMIRKKQFRAGAWLLGAPLALSGPMAFPFYSTLTSFVNMIASALFGDDRDMEKVFWDHIEANYDPAVVKVMKGGALGAMDVDLSSSLSVGIEAPNKLTDFFGVFGGALNDVSEAYKQANVGNWWRAVSKIMPGIISSSARAGLEYRSGVSTMRAQPLYDEKGNVVMPGLKQTITRGIAGLELFDIAEMKRKEYRAKRQLKTMKDKRDRILHSYRVYSSGLRHSPEFLKDIMTDVSEYNRKARLYGGNKAGIALITPQTLERQKEKFEHPSAQARKLYYKTP